MSDDKRPSAAMVVATISSPQFKDRVKASLPKNVDPDRFTRMTITALQNAPELLEADKDSLYLAILKCAETGLSPDGKESALVVFNTKVGDNRWIKKVQFMPMVTGIIKKLGEVGVSVQTETVHEFDFFEYEAGDNPKITHRPAKLGQDRGMMLGAYAILRMEGISEPYREVMDAKSIEVVRGQSRAPNSLMWTKFPGEGYRKTVLRRCAKRIPMKFDETVQRTLDADNATFEMESTPELATPDLVPAEKVVAALEQTKGQTLQQSVPAQSAQPESQPQPESNETQAKPRQRRASKPSPEQPPEESENPAPRDATPPEPVQPARPRGLAAVVSNADDDEDIF